MRHLYFKHHILPSSCALLFNATSSHLKSQNLIALFCCFHITKPSSKPCWFCPETYVTVFYHHVFSYLELSVMSIVSSQQSYIFTMMFERQILLRINLQAIFSHFITQQQWLLSFLMTQLQVCSRVFDYTLFFPLCFQYIHLFLHVPMWPSFSINFVFLDPISLFIQTSLDTADKIHLL